MPQLPRPTASASALGPSLFHREALLPLTAHDSLTAANSDQMASAHSLLWPLPIHCTLSRALCGHRLSAGHGGAQRCVCWAARRRELEDLCRVLGPFYAPAGTSCLSTFGAVSLSNSVCRFRVYTPNILVGCLAALRAVLGSLPLLTLGGAPFPSL